MLLSALAQACLLFIAVSSEEQYGDAPGGYHQVVGIPLSHWLKAREDRIHSTAESRIHKGQKVFGSAPETYAFFGGLIVNLLNTQNTSGCGSSLLTFKRLVTAAHCWDDGHVTADYLTVVLGSAFLFYGGVRIKTRKIVTHPKWNHDTIDNDIAIIYLPYKVNFSSTIFPIALPEGRELTQDFTLYFASPFGFGLTEKLYEDFFNSDGPSLRRVVVQIISNGDCSRQMWYPPSTEQMCTSGKEGKGPCYGDSGGPLITYTNRKFLIGITSFLGGPICGVGKPNIYTRVARYMDFIASHAVLPKFEFHFEVVGDGSVFENITIFIRDIE